MPRAVRPFVKTTGNPYSHIVLRGGTRANYDLVSVRDAMNKLAAKNLPEIIMIRLLPRQFR